MHLRSCRKINIGLTGLPIPAGLAIRFDQKIQQVMSTTNTQIALAPDLKISRILTGLWQVADMGDNRIMRFR